MEQSSDESEEMEDSEEGGDQEEENEALEEEGGDKDETMEQECEDQRQSEIDANDAAIAAATEAATSLFEDITDNQDPQPTSDLTEKPTAPPTGVLTLAAAPGVPPHNFPPAAAVHTENVTDASSEDDTNSSPIVDNVMLIDRILHKSYSTFLARSNSLQPVSNRKKNREKTDEELEFEMFDEWRKSHGIRSLVKKV